MINGLIVPTKGTIYVEDKDISQEDQIRLRRNIGYSIQGNVLFPHLDVEENISYVPNLLNKNDKERTKKAVDKWMEIVGLPKELKSHYPSQLSGGQQQRVGIARAFITHPDVVFADEPTGNLDTKTTAEVMKMITAFARSYHETIILVTHDPEMAAYADHIIKLSDGQVISDKTYQKGEIAI